MSRVSRNSSTSTVRRPPVTTRGASRPVPSCPNNNRPTNGGACGMTRLPPRLAHQSQSDRNNADVSLNNENPNAPAERSVHVGSGYQMFTPSSTKREQMRRQADEEQRQYEAHIEQRRLHNIHEVHRLGGDPISEEDARRRLAEKYRREKFLRLEKSHQDQLDKKQREETEIEAKKHAARQQATENEPKNRNARSNSMQPTTSSQGQGAVRWTDEEREADRRETMDRFLSRFTDQRDALDRSSDENNSEDHNDKSKSEKLSILREMLPYLDDQTLEYHLEVFNGNIDAVVAELTL